MSPCTLGVAAVHRELLSQRPKLEKTPNICMRGRLRNDLFFSRGVSISKKVQRKKISPNAVRIFFVDLQNQLQEIMYLCTTRLSLF